MTNLISLLLFFILNCNIGWSLLSRFLQLINKKPKEPFSMINFSALLWKQKSLLEIGRLMTLFQMECLFFNARYHQRTIYIGLKLISFASFSFISSEQEFCSRNLFDTLRSSRNKADIKMTARKQPSRQKCLMSTVKHDTQHRTTSESLYAKFNSNPVLILSITFAVHKFCVLHFSFSSF